MAIFLGILKDLSPSFLKQFVKNFKLIFISNFNHLVESWFFEKIVKKS